MSDSQNTLGHGTNKHAPGSRPKDESYPSSQAGPGVPLLPNPPDNHIKILSPDAASYRLDQTAPDFMPTPDRLHSQKYCMKSSIVGQSKDRTRAIIIPLPCKSWDCPTCGPRKRFAWISRLKSGHPDREITLTCPANKFLNSRLAALAMKTAWSTLVPKIRKTWGAFEYGLVWELTKQRVPHIHILARGAYIAQKWLSQKWERLGIGPIVYIKSVKGSKLHAAHACKYLAKSNGQSAAALAPLRIIQLSAHYELEPLPKTEPGQYPDMVWVWDRRSSYEIAREFTAHNITVQVHECCGGKIEIEMKPHPVQEDMLEIPQYWVAYPGLAPIPDSDEPLPAGHFLQDLVPE